MSGEAQVYQHGTAADGATYGEQPGPPPTWFAAARTYLDDALAAYWVPARAGEAIAAANQAVKCIAASVASLAPGAADNPGAAFVAIEEADGQVVVHVPAMPGVRASAPTLPEALCSLADAVNQYHSQKEAPP